MNGLGGETVLLDACVLIPIRLASALLWLAEAGLFEVLWSDRILDETERNLPKVGVHAGAAARRVAAMREAFGSAALVNDIDVLIPEMTCDPKDRHVLAAAVRGEATTLVTFNVKDFPRESTMAHGIETVHPDAFLIRVMSAHPNDVVSILESQVAGRTRPPETMPQFCAGLATTVPEFAAAVTDRPMSS